MVVHDVLAATLANLGSTAAAGATPGFGITPAFAAPTVGQSGRRFDELRVTVEQALRPAINAPLEKIVRATPPRTRRRCRSHPAAG
jgi:hypothetical protein